MTELTTSQRVFFHGKTFGDLAKESKSLTIWLKDQDDTWHLYEVAERATKFAKDGGMCDAFDLNQLLDEAKAFDLSNSWLCLY